MPVHLDASASPSPALQFGLAELRAALEAHPPADDLSFRIGGVPATPYPFHVTPDSQSYRLIRKHDGRSIQIVPGGEAGAMYACLDLAEAVRLGTLDLLKQGRHQPFIARRGIKFNLPLDARTPSYSDAGDSAQQNLPEVWDFGFWREFLDEMARHRFNVLTLWNLHPFPSLVRVPEYPEVALDDVLRSRARYDETLSLRGTDMVNPDVLADLETVRRMTIDEKIAYWRRVMRHACDRGIEVYLFTWNIFVWGAEGKHGISRDQTNPITLDYFRRSVRETVLTYPDLAGFGITAGENMEDGQGRFTREAWLWQAYGEGVRDAMASRPGRTVRMIHRCHETSVEAIADAWRDFPGPFEFSFKYAQAHMLASVRPPFADEALARLPPERKMWMTLRQDDQYLFRWSDPDFARAFLGNLPGPDKLGGFYIGPDGYVWGRDFVGLDPTATGQLEIRRQELFFRTWGRLAWDPNLPDACFRRHLGWRFPEADPEGLDDLIRAASGIIPLVNRFHWEDYDFQWYPEACLSRPSYKGFHTVDHFRTGRTMPGEALLSIAEYARRIRNGEPMPEGVATPPEVAADLRALARRVRDGLPKLSPARPGPELEETLADMDTLAWLGEYYAAKIEGALGLGLLAETGEEAHRAVAVRSLETALGAWRAYAATVGRHYRPQMLTRVGVADLAAITAYVEQDIEWAKAF